jgi:hypothetical protein
VVSTWEVWKADTVVGVQAVKWSVVLSMSTTVATRCYGIRYRAACESVTSRPVIWRFRTSAAVPPKSPRGGRKQVDDGDVRVAANL